MSFLVHVAEYRYIGPRQYGCENGQVYRIEIRTVDNLVWVLPTGSGPPFQSIPYLGFSEFYNQWIRENQ